MYARRKDASGGRTLHKLRHSRLTHLAEAGEDVAMIRAKSRHRHPAQPGPVRQPLRPVACRLTDRHDPNRRRHS